MAPVGKPFDAAEIELAALEAPEALELAVGKAEIGILYDIVQANSDQSLGISVYALKRGVTWSDIGLALLTLGPLMGGCRESFSLDNVSLAETTLAFQTLERAGRGTRTQRRMWNQRRMRVWSHHHPGESDVRY